MAASRVTFLESEPIIEGSTKHSIPVRSSEVNKNLKQTFHRRIDRIREKCSYALDLDIDKLIDANEAVGWTMPEGFSEFVEVNKENKQIQQIDKEDRQS